MKTKETKTRILLVSPMPPAVGGISISTARLRDRLLQDGYDVDTYNLQIKTASWIHPLWQIINTLFLPAYILFSKPYDIIHLHVSGYWRRVYVKMVHRLFKGAMIVSTVHGDLKYYLERPLADHVMAMGDRIICVRPGDCELFPEHIRGKAVEIPAFIMPTSDSITKEVLPGDVESFLSDVADGGLPLLLFNGSVVLSKPYNDLYGIEDFARLIVALNENKVRVAALVIINDSIFDNRKNDFIGKIERILSPCSGVKICKNKHFSLLPILNRENIIYVRPTKTDGDSLSVREALSLGASVVASNVAQRPQATICYDINGGPKALYDAVLQALSLIKNERTAENLKSNDYYDKIIGVYDSLVKKS